MTSPKKPYTAPKISEVGSVVGTTLGQPTGVVSDDAFPAGTPLADITLS